MRRLKRDPLEKAFLRGRGDNWDGMTGTAGIHRLNELHAVG